MRDEEKRREKARERVRLWREKHPDHSRQWKRDNRDPERHRAESRAYQLLHRAEAAARCKEWAKANPGKVLARKRAYREENRERMRDYAREYARKRRAESPERAREAQRKWKAMNPEKVRARDASRRVRKSPGAGEHSAADIQRLYRLQGGKCAACGRAFKTTGTHRYHVDHVRPLMPRSGEAPGTNGPENLQLLCRACNHAKHNRSPEDWAQSIGRLFV